MGEEGKTVYVNDVQNRSKLHYLIGLLVLGSSIF